MDKRTISPCYKYIARNISDEASRHTYAKNYMDNMLKHDVDKDEAIFLYCANGISPDAGVLFSVNGVTLRQEDYFSYVSGEEKYEVLECSKYYRTAMKFNQKNNVCLLCPYYKNYANKRYSDECSIFRFIIDSRANLEEVVALDMPSIFNSVIDVASELESLYPAIVPILNIAYEQLLLTDGIFEISDVRERLNKLVGKISASSAKYNSEVKKLLEVNHRTVPVAWANVTEDILNSNLLSFESVCQLLSQIDIENNHKQKKKRNKTRKETRTNSLFDFMEQSAAESLSNNEKEIKENEQRELSAIAPDDIPEITMGVDDVPGTDYYDGEVPSSIVPDDIPEIGMTMPEPPEDIIDGVPYNVPENIEYDEPHASAPVIVESDTSDSVSKDEVADTSTKGETEKEDYRKAIGKQQKNDNVSKTTETDIDGGTKKNENLKRAKRYSIPKVNDLSCVFIPVVSTELLYEYADSYIDNANIVFDNVRRSKRLPIEIVYDGKGKAYALLFVRNLGRYYYAPVDDTIPDTLKVLMQSQSVIKICYQPYYLYSLFRLYSCKISSVYSICTMDMLQHPKASVAQYEDFFAVYDANFPITVIDTGDSLLTAMVNNMQRYIQIEASQTRMKYNEKEYIKRQHRDEILGSSYLRIINLKTNDYLFELEPSGNIVYNPQFDLNARHDGFFVTYSVGLDNNGTEISLNDIYLGALYELCHKGRFKKYNIQLITLTAGTMVLFVGMDEYDLITTALQKYFNIYAIRHGYERFELNVAHQRIYVNEQRNAKQKRIPRTYNEAMDMLVTANDSVTVADSHIIRRKKASQTKRKKQTKKYHPE